ncbi:hypothetical protein KI387_011766, partial [Taxus chinensis]
HRLESFAVAIDVPRFASPVSSALLFCVGRMKMRSQSNVLIPLDTPTWTVCIRNIQCEEEFCRKQFVVHVLHHRRPNLSLDEIKEELYTRFKVYDMRTIFLSSFRTKKTRSRGFGLIYDTVEDAIRVEPGSKLMKNGIEVLNPRPKKDCLNRAKKIRGFVERDYTLVQQRSNARFEKISISKRDQNQDKTTNPNSREEYSKSLLFTVSNLPVPSNLWIHSAINLNIFANPGTPISISKCQ